MVLHKTHFRGKVLAELVSRTLVAVILILTFYGAFAYYISKKTFDSELGTRLTVAARMASQNIRSQWLTYLNGKGKLYEEYRRILDQQRELSQTENIFLLDEKGHVLVDARGRYEVRELYWLLQMDPDPFYAALKGRPSASLLYQGQDGGVYKVAYAAVPHEVGEPTVVLGLEANATFVAGLHQFAKVLFFLGLACLAAGAGLMFVFGRRLVEPLRVLAEASRKVAAGDFSSRVVVDAQNELGELAQAFNEMTQQLHAHNDYILESMGNGLVVVDLNGIVTTFNRAASRMLGIPAEKALGKPAEESFQSFPDLSRRIDAAVWEGAKFKDLEMTLSEANPTIVRLQTGPLQGSDGRVLGTEILLTDQTEVRHLENRIKASEKMATIGELAAGIAHEIRNPLGAMKGFTEILGRKIGANAEAKEIVDDIASEIEILNKIVTNFLVFARPTHVDSHPMDLSEAVQTVIPLIENDAERRKVKVVFREGRSITALLDLEQFRRAVLNVALNAVQASPVNGCVEMEAGGFNRIEFFQHFRECDWVMALSAQPAEFFAVVQVLDRGPGLPPESAGKLFTPFFTTKTEGFGLGLSITRKILEAHGGVVGGCPRSGGGAWFVMVVPVMSLLTESDE
jgi:nitrogen fixation/metabolism regulation signal transduction histidine kinase